MESLPQIDSFDDIQCEEIYKDGDSFTDHDGTVWDLVLAGPAHDELCYVTHDIFGKLEMEFDVKDIDFVGKIYQIRGHRMGGYYGLFLDLLLSGF